MNVIIYNVPWRRNRWGVFHFSLSAMFQSVVPETWESIQKKKRPYLLITLFSFLFPSSQRETYTPRHSATICVKAIPSFLSFSLVGSRNSPHHNSLIPYSNPPTEPYSKTLPTLSILFFVLEARKLVTLCVRHLFMGDLADLPQCAWPSIFLARLWGTQSECHVLCAFFPLEM